MQIVSFSLNRLTGYSLVILHVIILMVFKLMYQGLLNLELSGDWSFFKKEFF